MTDSCNLIRNAFRNGKAVMTTKDEFETEWPVYKRIQYLEQSPATESGNSGPPGGVIVRGTSKHRMYNPLADEPQVWLEFVNLKSGSTKLISTEAILEFTCRYGLLGLNRFREQFATPYLNPEGVPVEGEYVWHWKREIVRMNAICDVWEDLLNESTYSLERKFQPHPRVSGGVFYVYDRVNSPKRFFGEVVQFDPSQFDQSEWTPLKQMLVEDLMNSQLDDRELVRWGWGWEGYGDLNEPLKVGRAFIADVISKRLYKHGNPILEVTDEGIAGTFYVPSLLGAMYAQLWQEWASGLEGRIKRCAAPDCRRRFVPKKTSKQKWCHPRCGSRIRNRDKRDRDAR